MMSEIFISKTGVLTVSVLSLLCISLIFFLVVVFLKKRGNRNSARVNRLIKKHKDLISDFSDDHAVPDEGSLKKLKSIGNSVLIELFLDRAVEVMDKPTSHLQGFYDALGITDRYIEILKDSKVWKKRAFAAEKIGKIGSANAVPTLLSIICDTNNEDEDVRVVALRALGRIKDSRAIPFLIEALGYPETWLPPRIGEILVSIGEEAVDYLKKELKNFQNDSRRGWAAEILGWLQAKSAETVLIESLFDVSPEVRGKAAGALGKIKSERSISRLTELLISEPVPFVRIRVSQALGAIGNPAVIHYLVNMLKDPEWWVRVRAVEALEHIGEQSVPSLLVAIEDEDPEVRKRAALALERIGYIEKIIDEYQGEEYKPELKRILFLVARAGVIESLGERLRTSHAAMQKKIIRLFGDAATSEAKEPLIELLRSTGDWTVKARIIQSLGKIGAKETIPSLIGALKDEEYWVRRSAVEALGMLQAKDFSNEIAAILDDPNPLARESALVALSTLKISISGEKIEGLMYDPSPKVRCAAIRAMRDLGIVIEREKILRAWIEASEEVRIEAIRYFSAVRDAEVHAEVLRCILRGSEGMREEVVEYMRHVCPVRFSKVISLFDAKNLSEETLATLIEIASVIRDEDSFRFASHYIASISAVIREKAFMAIASFGFNENEKILERAITDPSTSVRIAVLASVRSGMGNTFLQKARDLSNDPDENVRLAFALAIGASGDNKFLPLIVEMLEDQSLGVVSASFISLASFHDPVFFRAFYSRNDIKDIRKEIRKIAGDKRYSSVTGQIREKAEHSRNLEVDLLFANDEREFMTELIRKVKEALDPVIRLNALEMLRIIATPEFFTSIMSVMKKDPFPEIRLVAMDVVAAVGRTEEVITALSVMLQDPSLEVRLKAAELLGGFRNTQALEALLHVLETSDRKFREAVTTALSDILSGETEKVAELVNSVPETKTRKIGMAWLMGKTRKKGATKFLINLLGDNDPAVRASAVGALAKFRRKQHLDHLEKLVYDPNERVRAATVNAIAAIGGERAFDIVKGAVEDIDRFVRIRAAVGLAKIDMKRAQQFYQRRAGKSPEFRSCLAGILCAAGTPPDRSARLNEISVSIIDELCDKKEMLKVFKQSSDRKKRLHAFRVLTLTGNGEYSDIVKNALTDPAAEIRKEAARLCEK